MITNLPDAKEFCLNRLRQALSAPLYATFALMFDVARQITSGGKSAHRTFQESLREVATWNNLLIEREVNKALSACPTLAELANTVLLCTASQYAAVHKRELDENQLPEIDVPRFIHDALIESSKAFAANPLLFGEESSAEVAIANRERALLAISGALERVLDGYVPLKSIFKPVGSAGTGKTGNSPRRNRVPPLLRSYADDTLDADSDPNFSLMSTLADTELGAVRERYGAGGDAAGPGEEPHDPAGGGGSEEQKKKSKTKVSRKHAKTLIIDVPQEASFSYVFAPSMVGKEESYQQINKVIH